jgi:hypothetical protein
MGISTLSWIERGRDGEPGSPSALPTDRDDGRVLASVFGLTGESKCNLINVVNIPRQSRGL